MGLIVAYGSGAGKGRRAGARGQHRWSWSNIVLAPDQGFRRLELADHAGVQPDLDPRSVVQLGGQVVFAVEDARGVDLRTIDFETGPVDEDQAGVAHRAGVSLPAAVLSGRTSLRSFLVSSLMTQVVAFRDPALRRASSELVAAATGSSEVDEAFRATLARIRSVGLDLVAKEQRAGAIRPDADGELLLDMVMGSSHYRLLWRGVAITESDVEKVIDQALNGILT